MGPSMLWLALLILKLSVLAIGAWLAEFSLQAVNPRWRVGLWRVAVVAACVLVAAAFAPPLYRWEIVRLSSETPEPVVVAIEPASDGNRPSSTDLETRSADVSESEVDPARLIESGEARERLRFDDPAVAPMAPLADEPQSLPSVISNAGRALIVRLWPLWPQVAMILWCVGIGLGLARVAFGSVYARRLVARSIEVSEATLAVARRLANCLRVRQPKVRSSTEVASPVLYGGVRPTILLPTSMAGETPNAELEAALAHELAHVAGRDAWWDLVLRIAACLAWPHPLAWWMPAAHRRACDRVSDLIAADALGDRGTYSRSLARIALRVAQAPPGAGLAMARRADVVERLRLIASDVRAASLGRRGWLATAVIGFAAFALGGLAVALTTRPAVAAARQPLVTSEPAAVAAETPDVVAEPTTRIVGRITDPAGKPLAGQQIVAVVLPPPPERSPRPGRRMEWKLSGEVPPSATSDEEGRFTIDDAAAGATIMLQFYGAELQQPREWRPDGSLATTITLKVAEKESELEVGYVPRNMTSKTRTVHGRDIREVAITWSPTRIKALWAYAPTMEKWKESRALAEARDPRWKDGLLATDETLWVVPPGQYGYDVHTQHIDFGPALELGGSWGEGLRADSEREIILFFGGMDPRTKIPAKP